MAKITIKQANAILKAAFDLQTVLVRRAVVEKLKRIDLDTADLLDAELKVAPAELSASETDEVRSRLKRTQVDPRLKGHDLIC